MPAMFEAGPSALSPPLPPPPPLAPVFHSASGPWQPPAPSFAALPVDQSKTDPKPAYYKLQFGDDITGFSYYVRTLSVVIGRNVVSTGASAPGARCGASVVVFRQRSGRENRTQVPQ